MILKRLTCTGFKSFADKTELDFGPGITCIVGPNGCGKSNVVDAIKWVLGEQSAKSLRGKQMLDVIFKGSGTRKSSGLSQVDLTFDNSDGTLPSDQTEVVVSRRLYRSGDSEYLLNKQACRLKDIRELFLDTGIGIDAYSVIEQGRVDSLLQANPTDRRTIFEEAAGISKYKVRKKEAQRRLDRVNQNLLRVQDVVDEVEKRLRSVKLAAGKARRYQEHTQRLRELRSRYALSEYHRLRLSMDDLTREIVSLTDRSTGLRTALSNNDAKTSESNVRIVDLEREISGVESRLLTVQSQITAMEERISGREKWIEDHTSLLANTRERLAGFDSQFDALDARQNEHREIAQGIATELGCVQAETADLRERDHDLSEELKSTQVKLEDEKSGIIDLLRRTSKLNNEIQGFNLQHESMVSQKTKLDERDRVVADELAQSMSREQQLGSRCREITQLVTDQEAKLAETKTRLSDLTERGKALADQHGAAKEYRSGLFSRQQVLTEMDHRHEGLLAGAREILQQRDADETGRLFDYVRGAVGELFDVEVAHAMFVEVALGHYQQYLVVGSREQLLADRDALAELSGRVQAFCLDRVPPAIGGPDLSEQEGVVGSLLDWITYPDDCERLARFLFGRTYVVESLDVARRLAQLDPSGARFVTMSGIVWSNDGRVSLGSIDSGAGMISRRSELRELAKELGEVDSRIVALANELEQNHEQASHVENLLQNLRTAIYEASTERVEVQTQLSAVEKHVKQLSDERPLIASEVSEIVLRLRETQEREEESKKTLWDLESRSSEGEKLAEELQQKIDEMASQRAILSEQMTSARVRLGELTQRGASVAETLREMESAKVQLSADREKAGRDVIDAKQRIEQSQTDIEETRKSLLTLRDDHEGLTSQSAMLRQERDDLRVVVENCGSESRRLRGELEEVESVLHGREIKQQEVRVRTEDLVARIAEELSVELETQYEGYVPDEEEDWPAVEAEIDELRAKIERLGNVNLDAISEQAELEQRLEFLTTQLGDLRSSEKQLGNLIDKLNSESIQRFIETFKAVQGHFSSLFKKLFGGGKAELSLMDMDDVLECGIEITARPPGKEPQSISLLSGGEKTMTAIALLLAVFRSRPSPFVLLDEVDAALDEANNIRFNHVIQEFVDLSQFIIITHAKRTMAIADLMYGITMQEAGVSKRVSVRFGDHQEQEPAVA